MAPSTLTNHFLSKFPDSWKRATEHPFLLQAGKRTLATSTLEEWLCQDAIYAGQGYAKAMGGIVSFAQACPVNLFGGDEERFKHELELHLDVVKLIGEALVNINREIRLFMDTAQKYKLQLGPVKTGYDGAQGSLASTVKPHTRSYVNFMWITCRETSLEEGLFLLWAMEEVYASAWLYAKKQQISPSPVTATRGALDTLIDNWTSSEFQAFVQELRDMVNRLEIPIDPKNCTYQKLEQIFVHILWLEERFWPQV